MKMNVLEYKDTILMSYALSRLYICSLLLCAVSIYLDCCFQNEKCYTLEDIDNINKNSLIESEVIQSKNFEINKKITSNVN